MDTNDFGKILLSPPVIIGGIALGAILLLTSHAGATPATGSPAADPAVLNASVAMNNTAAQQQVQLAQIAAQAGASAYAYNTQTQGQILAYLTSQNNNSAKVNETLITSQAGITQAQIAGSTAIAVDINNNLNRLDLAQEQAKISADQTQGAINIATIQANAATKIAKTNAIAGIVTGVTKTLTAPFTGGASLLTPTFNGVGTGAIPSTSPGNGYGTGLVYSDPGAILGI